MTRHESSAETTNTRSYESAIFHQSHFDRGSMEMMFWPKQRGDLQKNPGDMAGCLARYFPGGGGCGRNVGYAAGANRQKATWQQFGLRGGPTLAAVFPRTLVFYIILYVNLLTMGSLKLARWIPFAK
jgi:hypothetical protein